MCFFSEFTCEKGAVLQRAVHAICVHASRWFCTQLVQCLTKLRLHIRQARISSDRGWFVDGELSVVAVERLC